MPATKNPNFFPYANAAFCRPNWYPSEAVQKEAGALLALQSTRRNRSQRRMDHLVNEAQNADHKHEAAQRRALALLPSEKCRCAPPAGHMRYVLQPHTGSRPEPQPPGGNWVNDALDWFHQTGTDAGDTLASAACQGAGAIGLLGPAQELAQTFETYLGRPSPAGNAGGQWVKDVIFGGVPYFAYEVIDTCEVGSALRNYAAAERDRMQVAGAIFAVIAAAGGIPTGGLSVATAGSASAFCYTMGNFWAQIARGDRLSLDMIYSVLVSAGQADAALVANRIGAISGAVQDAFNAPTVEQGQTEIQEVLIGEAGSPEEASVMEAAILHLGQFAHAGTVGTSDVASQPSPWSPTFAIFPSSPNPLVVRPDLLAEPPQGPYVEEPPDAPKEGAGVVPIVGLGILLDLVL